MKQETFLVLIIGLFVGFILGFGFANYFNRDYTATNWSGAQSQTADAPNKKETEIEEAERLADENPQSFDAQMRLAQLYNAIKDAQETLEHLTRANQLSPENYEAIVALGNFNLDTGNFAEAEPWYLAALAKKPNDANVRADLANSFYFRETPDIDRAITGYKRCLEQNSTHEEALQNLTAALTRKGSIKEARSILLRLEKVNPTNSSLDKLRVELDKKAKE